MGSVGRGGRWGGGGEGGARRGTVLLACTTCRVAVTGCLTFENVRETEATEQGGKRTVLLLRTTCCVTGCMTPQDVYKAGGLLQ